MMMIYDSYHDCYSGFEDEEGCSALSDHFHEDFGFDNVEEEHTNKFNMQTNATHKQMQHTNKCNMQTNAT